MRALRNVKLVIQYEGTNYAGWQYQKNALSVQEVLEKALHKITGERVRLKAAGRTDAGVHAKAQVANFRTATKISLKKLKKALNSILPDAIAIADIGYVLANFNAQFDAKSKVYRYTIVTADHMDPFIRRFAARSRYRLNTSVMKREAKSLLGKHDFRSFATRDGEDRSAIRKIKAVCIRKRPGRIYIDIEADGFLYNMVRNVVGTLIEVGRGKFPEGSIKKILAKRDNRFSGPTAPSRGLTLLKINY